MWIMGSSRGGGSQKHAARETITYLRYVIPQTPVPPKPPCRIRIAGRINSKNLDALIVAEEPHVKSWEDGQYNIQNMSIEETYGFGILQEGQAVAVAKNVRSGPTSSLSHKS